MIKFLFLIPTLLCLGWFLYLRQYGYSFEQGKKGYTYILIFSAVIALFYTILLWLTHI
ncbi:hypothetical protein [Neptunicella sp. SCSIO 80796]|uniref:hypothetical protein n=1 Tax=Neptunicella plasticusilytica TaxID=3117012 RepID=UPI003A4D6EC8